MQNGAFALLERSLRIDARSWSTHLARLGLIGAIYVSLCLTVSTQFRIGAPGLSFFQGIASLDAFFMTLLGIGFFSTAITEEKEEDTLGLMMMAGISPVGILVGKAGGRLWQALLLVAVQYPFTLLAVTMGGVTSGQIWAMTVALLAYMLFLSGFGLLCSTVAPRSRTAGIVMIGGIVAYIGLPVAAKGVVWIHRSSPANWTHEWNLAPHWWDLLDRFGDLSVFVRMPEILSTGFAQSALTLQVVSNVAGGLISAGMAWLVFGIATRSPATESSSRGLVSQRRGFFRFSPGRSWDNPFVWKDFYFAAGGIWMLLIRVAFYGGLGTVIYWWQQLLGLPYDVWVEVYLMWIMFLLPVDAALLVARSMHDEVRGQTLASLMMLPKASNGTVYSKFAGALLGWLPGPIFGISTVLMTNVGQRGLRHLLTHQDLWVVPVVFLFFALVPHYAALLALYVRWGAVPLAIGLTLGTYFVIGVGVMVVSWMVLSPRPGVNFGIGFQLAMTALSLVLLSINAACHIGVLLRVESLGAK